jgi:4-hydroxy-2-oxoheptanedioate aldolase
MDLPPNQLKRAFRDGRPQIGLWSQLTSPVAAEILSRSGFDFVVIDTEHAPNDLPQVVAQLQAMAGGTASPVVRAAWNDAVLIKRLLDVGAQSLIVPFVQDADEARRAVAATRYPPHGVRGVAVATRASGYGRATGYLARAHEELCVLVQAESRAALANIESIAAVDGVDGLFIGPGDLSADLGHLGNPGHPDVLGAIDDAIRRIRAARKVAGILAPVEADARRYLDAGCLFVAVGSDVGILARQSEALAARLAPRRGV